MEKDRIKWIDIAKGITIILVIVGHTVRTGGLACSIIRGVIFSFHMPLFFMLSCYTYRCSSDISELIRKVKRAAFHLLIPAAFVFAVHIANDLINSFDLISDLGYWKTQFYTLVFSSGMQTSFAGFDVPAMGMAWFFIALFIGRSLYDYIHLILEKDKLIRIACMILSCVGVCFGYAKWLPFSLDIVLAIMPLFYLGEKMREEKYTQSIIKAFVIWIVLLLITSPDFREWSYLELAVRRYPLYPICFIAAVFGTYFVCNISKQIVKMGKIVNPLLFIGKYSLFLFVIHAIDFYPIFSDIWRRSDSELINCVFRVCFDLVIFFIFMMCKLGLKKAVKKN